MPYAEVSCAITVSSGDPAFCKLFSLGKKRGLHGGADSAAANQRDRTISTAAIVAAVRNAQIARYDGVREQSLRDAAARRSIRTFGRGFQLRSFPGPLRQRAG